MIFAAHNINALREKHADLCKVFTEGFKIVFDGAQIGLSGIFALDTWTLHDYDDAVFLENIELEASIFPLYFEVREDDFVRENRIQKWPNLYANENN